MTQWLAGGKAFITGGGGSVGRACVELFLQEGAQVAFLEVNPERTQATMAATGALGYTGDMMDKHVLVAAIDDAASKLGGLTVLVNTPAGYGATRPTLTSGIGGLVTELTDQLLANNNLLHINAHLWATQAAIPHMLKSGKGSIIQFGSVASTNPGWSEVYGIQKAGQTTLAYQCAMEYAPTIRSNALICGWMEPAYQGALQRNPAGIAKIMADHPLHHPNSLADLAKACLFLASDLGSAINGELVFADGGQTRSQANMSPVMRELNARLRSDRAFAARQHANLHAATPDELP